MITDKQKNTIQAFLAPAVAMGHLKQDTVDELLAGNAVVSTGPAMVTVNQAAEILACSRRHIYYLVARGELTKINRSSRFSRLDRDQVYKYAGLTKGA